MAKVLEALIAKGRRVRRPREQREVSFGLADLSTHPELHERIVKKGGIKSLLNLLTHAQDAAAQRFSALAMANCASAVFNRLAIASEGVMQPLIDYVRDGEADLIGRQLCLRRRAPGDSGAIGAFVPCATPPVLRDVPRKSNSRAGEPRRAG